MKVKSDWPRRLKDLRIRLKISQRVAAASVSVVTRTWIRWEMGHGAPHPAIGMLLAEFEKHPEKFLKKLRNQSCNSEK